MKTGDPTTITWWRSRMWAAAGRRLESLRPLRSADNADFQRVQRFGEFEGDTDDQTVCP